MIGNAHSENSKEDPDDIKARIAAFVKFKTITEGTKARLNDLMSRPGAKKWDDKKKARMVRKYVATEQALNEATDVIDQLEFRLSQITTASSFTS